MTQERNQNGSGGVEPGRMSEERVEDLLQELRPIDLPPFYRARLLARIRAASERPGWRERLSQPALAWSVAGACVVALVLVVLYAGRPGTPAGPVAPGVQIAESSIDPVMPVDSSVVGAGDVEIVAAIDPPVEGGLIRLYVDERDVTGLAEVTESYVMYSPGERFEEGEHIVTIEITDRAGHKIKDLSWLFYTLNGREPAFDPRT
jgi:hypothetical protein